MSAVLEGGVMGKFFLKNKLFARFPHQTCAFLKKHFSVSAFHLGIVYLSMVCQSPINSKTAFERTSIARHFDTKYR